MAIYKLGDVCHYIEGYVNPIVNDKNNFSESGLMWLKVSELKHGSTINKSSFHLSNKAVLEIKKEEQFFKRGTIVWSKSGSVGNVSILGEVATANRGILNIIPNEKILNKYLFYNLISRKEVFKNAATGAVLKHLYGPKLMQFEIDVPTIFEQQKIIDIIEPIEHLIDLAKDQIQKIKQTITLVINSSKKESYKLKEMGEILPFSFIKNRDPEGKIPFYSIKTLGNYANEFINEDQFKKECKNKFEINDLIISTRGTLGRVHHVKETKSWYLSSVMVRFRLLETKKAGVLASLLEKVNWNTYKSGSAIPMLTNKDINNIKIEMPINESIYSTVNCLVDLKYILQKKLEKATNIKEEIIKLLIK